MRARFRPHVLGIDDGPFEKHVSEAVPLVGVMMEAADLVEAVAITQFPVDGEDVTDFLAQWISGLRFAQGLQAVLLGGVTIVGLGVVDVASLAAELAVPVLVVNRRDPARHRVGEALRAAGLAHRLPLLERAPAAFACGEGLFVGACGATQREAERLVRATRGKSQLPEPLRLAHLIARALVTGESRGRP